MLWALLGKYSENSCQKHNNSLRTRRDQGKPTVLPESTLNFAYKIPVKFNIFYCVRRCPNSCFHYYFLSIPYTYQSRQLSWMSCDHKICVCYFRLFNFVICYKYEKFGICKAVQFWSDKCIFKSCCIFADHLPWTKTFPKSSLYMWQTMSFKRFVYHLQIIESIFCLITLGRHKSPILHPVFDGLSICCLALDILS